MPSCLKTLVQVRSNKVKWWLKYLDAVAENAAKLPGYFPKRFNQPEDTPAFDFIRQQLQVIEDREQFDQEQAKRYYQFRLENELESIYSPNLKDVISGDFEDRMKEEEPATFTWDERAIHRYPRLTIISDPGYGKTWLLKYEARRWAVRQATELRAQRIGLDSMCLPVFVHLANLAKRSPKTDSAVEQALAAIIFKTVSKNSLPFNIQTFLTEKLQNGDCILLFDAWD